MSPAIRIVLPAAALCLAVAGTAGAQEKGKTAKPSYGARGKRSNAELIRSALSAAPRSIAAGAAVVVPDSSGNMVELRPGTNGFTCVPELTGTQEEDPICMDAEALKWGQSLMAHEAKPANTQPGIAYMLAGGRDYSSTDPFVKSGPRNIVSPPHWMLLWPVDAKASGLSTTPKKTGTWIMFAGTPWAHLMINQTP
ncbi:MAG TPA: hypothetical protein VNS52_02990 [Gemmatimonadaceae bacterium]|nr:hypothetical protein [Gemmatimonadaceae bacterium]